jgi:hypothetical protein
MKNKSLRIIILSSIIIFSISFLVGCSKDNFVVGKATWQGMLYPNGCLTCEEDYVYSPIFDNFEDCKTWALNQKSNPGDKVTCSKNCKNPDEWGMQTCEEVIRNWKPTPDSVTFEEYKD